MMRTFDQSMTLRTGPLASAQLEFTSALGVVARWPLTVANSDDGTSTVSTTAALPKGVLTLRVTPQGEGCCPSCWFVYSKGCERASLLAQHSAGSQLDTGPVPTCNPVVA